MVAVKDLNSSSRGHGGFGHTGKKWAHRALCKEYNELIEMSEFC
jgi:hypothetical protein